jgi:type II secretory pathway pseudopilin PulG
VRSRLNDEAGIGLIELLIATTVMAIGIFAVVAGFSSGFGAINRASKHSTAAALADKQMETLRRGTWASLSSIAGTSVPGPDGRTYFMATDVVVTCPDESTPTGAPLMCTINSPAPPVTSFPVKRATVTVRDGSTALAPVLITESATFDQFIG